MERTSGLFWIVLITTLPVLLIVTALLYLVLDRRVELGVCSGPE